jgi:hypothetical protein
VPKIAVANRGNRAMRHNPERAAWGPNVHFACVWSV